MIRSAWAAGLTSTIWLAGAGFAAAAVPAPSGPRIESEMTGSAGVCVRWGADDDRVEEAVIVRSSGNPELDATIRQTLQTVSWARPDGDMGEWTPLNVAVGAGAPRPAELPDCAALTSASNFAAPQSASPSSTAPSSAPPTPPRPEAPRPRMRPVPLPEDMQRT